MSRAVSPTPSGSSDAEGFDFMEEPKSFRPATPPPSVMPYDRREYGGHGELIGEEDVQVRLVSGHPLWGHILYPAAIALSRFLEIHADTLLRSVDGKGKGKNVLELGAGGGLPGLIAALEGASQVVISDFPDPSLVNNIEQNIVDNVRKHAGAGNATSMGYTWGAPITEMLAAINPDSTRPQEKFDLILLSDLVFNHSQHEALLDTCLIALNPTPHPASPSPPSPDPSAEKIKPPSIDHSLPSFTTPAVLCFYSHHRPTEELIAADLGFIVLAKAKGWTVKRIWKDQGAGPAFPEDAGSICIRSTCHGWALTRDFVAEE